MSDNSNPVPRGVSNSGEAVEYGPGLGALHYLQRVDLMAAKQKERVAQQKVKEQEAGFKSFLTNSKLSDEGGVHFGPQLKAKADEFYQKNNALLEDRTLTPMKRAMQQQLLRDEYNRTAKASVSIDKHLGDTIRAAAADKRINEEAAGRLVYGTLYNKDGAGISPADYDPRTATAALTVGNEHLVAPEIYSQFLDKQPENSISYSQEALPGGRGRRQVAKSNIFELTADGQIKRDPATNKPVLRDTPETLAAFDSDAINRQYLDGFERVHQQQLAGAVEKMSKREQLTPEEAEAVRVEQSPTGRRMELFKKGLMQYGYGRQETALLAKAAPRPPAAKQAPSPKFSRVGGLEFGPELTGGTAAGGTQGLLALASSDPLVRVKADGSHQPFTAKAAHRQYVLLQNGQSGQLVTNNAAPQNLTYTKPQLYLTTADGNVATPKDPMLLQRFESGDKQPLLDWMRTQREAHPGYALKWHFQAVPTTGKLEGQNQAPDIYKRLVDERAKAGLSAGQAGYHSNDELQSTAQKLASQQGATMLIPYTGSDKRDIDRATDFLLRDVKRQKAMQDQLDYFNSQTVPRPAEQRAAPKKSLGINFGTPSPTAAPAAPPTSSPAFKRAGAKKTGIQF